MSLTAIKRVYVSGPMTGLPDLNYPAFHAASQALRSIGLEVANPAELNDGVTDYNECLRNDLKAMLDCDAVVLLDGWESSKGAHLELSTAHAVGIKVATFKNLYERLTNG